MHVKRDRNVNRRCDTACVHMQRLLLVLSSEFLSLTLSSVPHINATSAAATSTCSLCTVHVNCLVIAERELFKPDSVACRTGSKNAANMAKKRQHRMSYGAGKDANLHTENGIWRSPTREISRHHSAADEALYCPMNGVRVESGRRLLPAVKANNGHAVQTTPVNLCRAFSDETLSLHSHSRRLQRMNRDTARKTPTHIDRRTSALDVATNSATNKSRGRRDRRVRTVIPQRTTNMPSGVKSRRSVVNNRPDLLCTWKDRDGWNQISPQSYGTADLSGPRHSSPQDGNLQQQCAGENGSVPAATQSPQWVVSDGSPGSQYPTAPAASPVTLNSVVFTPPPCTLVSSSTTAVWPTTSLPLQPSKMDCRSNTDSGYGSKIYRCLGTAPAVTSCQEHLARPVETVVSLQSRMCSSIPDVLVDQRSYHAEEVMPAATLPRTTFDRSESSGHQLCQGDAGASPPNLDLMTYSETNLVVSPCRTDHRQSRVPIELADENSVAEIGETFSPMSPLSLDSFDFVAEKFSDCILSSPADDVPIATVPAAAILYPEVPHSHQDGAADEQLYSNVNSASETDHQLPGSRSLGSINEDVQPTNGERDLYRSETDSHRTSPVSDEDSFEHITDIADSSQVRNEVVHYQMVCDAQERCLQIGRCTTV